MSESLPTMSQFASKADLIEALYERIAALEAKTAEEDKAMSWMEKFFKRKPDFEYEIQIRFDTSWISLHGTERTKASAKSRVENYLNDLQRQHRLVDLPDMRIVEIATLKKRRTVWRLK